MGKISFKKLVILCFIAYTAGLNALLLVHFKINNFSAADIATIKMGLSLFLVWVIAGGLLQLITRDIWLSFFKRINHPFKGFVVLSIIFALIEEAVATTITNLAPFYGVGIGEAYITASTNYLRVISLHSVIVFIPMLMTLGYFLRRYTISPFQTFMIFGLVGVVAEISFSGFQAFINAPAWICIYGLMVYIPAQIFQLSENRKRISIFMLPLLIPIITFSAVFTAWIPTVLNTPKIEFETYLPETITTNSPRK